MSKKNNYRCVAYDAANGDYEEFETLKEAEGCPLGRITHWMPIPKFNNNNKS